jgi:hypothetical protein
MFAVMPALAQIEQQDVGLDTDNHLALPVVQETEIASCEGIIHQIHNDISGWPTTTANQYLPWMQITWLKNHLGQPQTANVRDYVYVWKNFSLYVGADGSTERIGTLPHQMRAQSLDEATQIMGKPKKIFLEQLNLYQWVCPTLAHPWIAMLTTKNAASISIMGSDCSNNTCETFSSAYAESEIKQKFKKQMKEQADISMNLLALRLKNYNEYFKTSLQSQTQLTEDIIARIKNYYISMRECKKGIYQYVTPVLQDYLYQTSTINKLQDDRCLVDISYKIPNIGNVSLKCKFPLQNLGLFSDDAAESAARGFVKIDSDLQKMINNECKRYIGGVL